jgi:RNA polymerase sigma-70 factor (ECF subfamily)
LRAWLRSRAGQSASDVEDTVQECYCVLSSIGDPGAIAAPRAYLFTVARNICLQQSRRARIVRIAFMAESDLTVPSDEPSPERVVSARQELARVRQLIAALPERMRRVVELRRFQGLSQRETASQLGVSETIVENDSSRALRQVLRALTGEGDEPVADGRRGHARKRG